MDWTTSNLTRRSLLSRIKRWDDDKSWREFEEIYHRLIFAAALRAGLTEPEAEDVVQETVLAVARCMKEGTFHYAPERCKFRTWLCGITKRQVANQYRKRLGKGRVMEPLPADDGESLIQEIPDSASAALDELWEQEWKETLVRAARERVKRRTSPAQFMIYEYHVIQEQSVRDTMRALGVTRTMVYLAKHRIGTELRKEVALLVQDWEQGERKSRSAQ